MHSVKISLCSSRERRAACYLPSISFGYSSNYGPKGLLHSIPKGAKHDPATVKGHGKSNTATHVDPNSPMFILAKRRKLSKPRHKRS